MYSDQNNMLIMLKVDGSWDESYVFCNKRTCGLIVPDETLYVRFIALVYSCIGSFAMNEKLKISYLVEECPPPVVVNDDYSLCFYLALKKSQPDYAKYPLCVELFPLSVSTASHFSSQLPAFDLNVAANGEFDDLEDTSIMHHHTFHISSPQNEDMSLDMYATNADISVQSDISGSSNAVSSPTSSGSEDLAVNEHFDLDYFHDFQDIQVICHFHPTRIAKDAIYQDKKSLAHHLKMYAISNLFQYQTKTSTRKVLHVVCVDDENCDWAVRAVRLSGSQMFQVKRFDSVHTCSLDVRQGPHRQATTEIIAELIKHRYADASRKPYAPKDIIVDLNRDYGLTIPYKKAWLANKKAQEKLMGSDEQSYQLLPSMAYVLRKKHPGSLILLDVGAHNRFKSFFMSLNAWMEGWKHCVPVLIIDGSFMKAYYKGTLLTACGQDSNNQIFPLAFGVCDTERRKTWTWFFMKLKECLAHREDMYIVSDRHDGIIHAAKVVFPHAEHGYCAYHILGNIRSKFKGSTTGLAWKFNQAARAATPAQFEEYMALLDAEDPRIRDYLNEIGVEKWARCFAPRSRYSIMTSNNAESVNSVDRVPREYPIAKLIDFLGEGCKNGFVNVVILHQVVKQFCLTILNLNFVLIMPRQLL
ncbi:unnamed protein product [Cuscuta epithymum]|uniref:Uncharacterized protein n=1 Tax=Cuscuta epithymum TaxID=186058 RepID=A0AAV0DA09_9ASTE|nr:unnamed protein product [Cuscuta epithymum]